MSILYDGIAHGLFELVMLGFPGYLAARAARLLQAGDKRAPAAVGTAVFAVLVALSVILRSAL